jgi:hypothetical protein
MSYRVTGVGTEPVSSTYPNLERAARTASKMEDQGVGDVRVFDPSGAEVPRSEWEAAWWQWAERNPRPR